MVFFFPIDGDFFCEDRKWVFQDLDSGQFRQLPGTSGNKFGTFSWTLVWKLCIWFWNSEYSRNSERKSHKTTVFSCIWSGAKAFKFVEFENCWKMHLLSKSETFIQLRMSLVKCVRTPWTDAAGWLYQVETVGALFDSIFAWSYDSLIRLVTP